MKRSVRLFVGSYLIAPLAVQMAPQVLEKNTSVAQQLKNIVPIYHQEHAKELMRGEASLASPSGNVRSAEDYALFLESRTEEALPETYKVDAARVTRTLIETANLYKMDPGFLMAVIKQESRFNPEIVGTHGEIGLMQIKPSTAQWIAAKSGHVLSEVQVRAMLFDPAENIRLGGAYLNYLRTRFKGRSSRYIEAYNMGAENVISHIRDGSTPRTYTRNVLSQYREITFASYAPARRLALHSANFDL